MVPLCLRGGGNLCGWRRSSVIGVVPLCLRGGGNGKRSPNGCVPGVVPLCLRGGGDVISVTNQSK